MTLGTKISAALCLAFTAVLAALLPSYLALQQARALFLLTFPPSALMPGTAAGEVNSWLMIGILSTVLGAAALFVVFLSIAVKTGRSVIQPLRTIHADLENVAGGQLNVTPALARKDEIGALSRAIETLGESLSQQRSDTRDAHATLAASEARFRDFVDAGGDWLWETDAAGRVVYFSGRLEDGSDLDPQTMVGQPMRVLFAAETPDGGTRALELDSRRPIDRLRCAFSGADGTPQHVLMSGRPVTDKAGAFQGYRGIARATRDGDAAFAAAPGRDKATGLPNRASFAERLDQAFVARQFTKGDVAVLHVDLDRFRDIEEAHGAASSDLLLSTVGHRLRARLGPQDSLAKLDRDGFAILQPFGDQPEAAEALCRSVMAAFETPFPLEDAQVQLSASVGCALAGKDAGDATNLMKNAEIAMYRAKDDGRATFRFHDPGMSAELAARQVAEREFLSAFDAGQITVAYQPIVQSETGLMTGLNASLHWARKGHGLVHPAQFLPLAETAGHGEIVLEHLLNTACADAAAWAEMSLVIDLSPDQFRCSTLVEKVCAALRDSRFPPHRLELAVAEEVLLEDEDGAQFRLDALRDYGVNVTLSGFGARAGSVRLLQRCRFDRLIFDRRLVSNVAHDPEKSAVLPPLVALAGALGTACDAAHVDLETDAHRLVEVGCARLQGALYGKPGSAARVTSMLRTQGLVEMDDTSISPS